MTNIAASSPDRAPRAAAPSGGAAAHPAAQLLEQACADTDTVLKETGSQLGGLSEAEAAVRLDRVGTNEIAREKRQSALMRLSGNVKNPLVVLLLALGVVSIVTGDLHATVLIFVDVDPGRGVALLPGDTRR